MLAFMARPGRLPWCLNPSEAVSSVLAFMARPGRFPWCLNAFTARPRRFPRCLPLWPVQGGFPGALFMYYHVALLDVTEV